MFTVYTAAAVLRCRIVGSASQMNGYKSQQQASVKFVDVQCTEHKVRSCVHVTCASRAWLMNGTGRVDRVEHRSRASISSGGQVYVRPLNVPTDVDQVHCQNIPKKSRLKKSMLIVNL